MTGKKRLFTVIGIISCILCQKTSLFADSQPPKSERYVGIVIAVDDYADKSYIPLTSAVNDAKALHKLLLERYNFEEVITLYNEKATKTTILNTLKEQLGKAKSTDNILVFFSGHSQEIDGEGYWIPHDGKVGDGKTFIEHQSVQKILRKSDVKHFLILADAIFNESTLKTTELFYTNTGLKDYYEKIQQYNSRQAIFTGNNVPYAEEGDVNSTFGRYLVRYLERNGKERLAIYELYEMLRYPVGANSPNIPVFGHFQDIGHEGGQFVFKLVLDGEKQCNLKIGIEEGDAVQFNKKGTIHAVVPKEEGLIYEWLKDGKIIGNARMLDVATSGKYNLKVSTEYGCVEETTTNVTVNRGDLTVRIAEETFVEFRNTGVLHPMCNQSTDVTYEWRKDNLIISRKKDLRVHESGFYTVTAYAEGGQVAISKVTGVTIIEDKKYYKVKSGDDIQRIAKKMYNNPDKWLLIYEANKDIINDQEILMIGQELLIPDDIEIEFSIEKPLKIVAGQRLPPFTDEDFFRNGLVTDLTVNIFDEMEQKTELEFMSWKHAKNVTKIRAMDAAFPFVKTPELEKDFYLSEPLYKILTVWFVRADARIKVGDLKKKTSELTVGVVEGYDFDGVQEYIDKGLKVVTYASVYDCFEMLYKGKVDLVAVGQMTGLAVIQNVNYMHIEDFRILGEPLGTQTLHLIVSKEHENGKALIFKFNAIMEKYKEEGKLSKLNELHLDLYQRLFDD